MLKMPKFDHTVVARSSLYFIINYSLALVMNKYFVLLNYSCKYWSIIKARDSFKICSSWGFQNWPWKLYLTKICLTYPRSKIKSNLKHYFGNNLQSFTLIFSAKSWSNFTSSDSFGILRMSRFWNCPWFQYLAKIWRSN